VTTKEEQEELRRYLRDLPLLARGNKAQRKAKAMKSFFYFIITYMSHHVEDMIVESSEFRKFIHKELDRLGKKHKKLQLSAYRGGAKTTTVSRLYPLWKLAKGETRFTIFISDTLPVALFEL